MTDNLAQDIALLDGAFTVPDADTIRMVYHLLDRDGLYVGASTALNVVAARKLAEKLGKGSRVVTILCDGAYRCALPPHSLAVSTLTAPSACAQVPVAPVLAQVAREQEPVRRDPRQPQEVRRPAVDASRETTEMGIRGGAVSLAREERGMEGLMPLRPPRYQGVLSLLSARRKRALMIRAAAVFLLRLYSWRDTRASLTLRPAFPPSPASLPQHAAQASACGELDSSPRRRQAG